MDIPPTFQSMTDRELVDELIATTEHLQNCRLHGQIDMKQMNIQSIVREEILNRMED
jgi:hypothetical protein